MTSKKILRIVLITVLILLIPLVAMQFTDEVAWDLADFIVMGTLLLGTGLLLEFAIKRLRGSKYQIIIITAIIIIFLLIWTELGVGIFGTPWAGS